MKSLIGEATDWVELFENVFQLNVSVQFLNCMDEQLGRKFLIAADALNRQRFLWPFEKQPEIIYGVISTISARFFMPQVILDGKIAWWSKSGRLYQIADEDINVDDIEFWVAELHKTR